MIKTACIYLAAVIGATFAAGIGAFFGIFAAGKGPQFLAELAELASRF